MLIRYPNISSLLFIIISQPRHTKKSEILRNSLTSIWQAIHTTGRSANFIPKSFCIVLWLLFYVLEIGYKNIAALLLVCNCVVRVMAFIPIVFCPLSASYTFEHCQDTILTEASLWQRAHIVWILWVDNIERFTIKTPNLKSTSHKILYRQIVSLLCVKGLGLKCKGSTSTSKYFAIMKSS